MGETVNGGSCSEIRSAVFFNFPTKTGEPNGAIRVFKPYDSGSKNYFTSIDLQPDMILS